MGRGTNRDEPVEGGLRRPVRYQKPHLLKSDLRRPATATVDRQLGSRGGHAARLDGG